MATYRGKKKIEVEVEITLERPNEREAKRLLEEAFGVVADKAYGDHVRVERYMTVPFTATTMLV